MFFIRAESPMHDGMYVSGISSDITIIAACNIQNTYERATYDITFKSYLMMKNDNRSPT